MTLDRAVNQRRTCVNKQKVMGSIGGCGVVIKLYMRCLLVSLSELDSMRSWVRASLQSQRTQHWPQRLPVVYPRPRSRRSAKWGLEDNTACYGQEEKLWVNIAACLLGIVRLSHTTEASTPYERIKRRIYLIIKSCGSSFNRYITTRHININVQLLRY